MEAIATVLNGFCTALGSYRSSRQSQHFIIHTYIIIVLQISTAQCNFGGNLAELDAAGSGREGRSKRMKGEENIDAAGNKLYNDVFFDIRFQ
jgi:hypothetical protein